jgi:hypothetical protein
MQMKAEHFVSKNTDPRYTFNPVDILKQNLTLVNNVLRYMELVKSKANTKWTNALKRRLDTYSQGFKIDYSLIDLEEFVAGLDYLIKYPELQDSIIQFAFKELNMPEDYIPKDEETETNFYDWSRSSNVLRYHRVKALFDIMDREVGIKLWKEMVHKATEDALENDDEIYPTIKEITDGWLENGKKERPSDDYTVAVFDEHMVALRFDRCPVFDAMKHLEDREAVYLSYCWTGEPEEALNKKSRRKYTPCTLYTSDHCIEFYWNNDVHPDAKPPSDEFWEELKEGMKSE